MKDKILEKITWDIDKKAFVKSKDKKQVNAIAIGNPIKGEERSYVSIFELRQESEYLCKIADHNGFLEEINAFARGGADIKPYEYPPHVYQLFKIDE